MHSVYMDKTANAIMIEFEPGLAGHTKQLDAFRFVDYSRNPGHPIGVSLHKVSDGVKLDGLPQPDVIRDVLEGLGVSVL